MTEAAPAEEPSGKGARTKMPAAPPAELPKAYVFNIETSEAVVQKLQVVAVSKAEDAQGAETFEAKIMLDIDGRNTDAVLPYADALQSIRAAQADVGAKSTTELKLSRDFANGIIAVEDPLLKIGFSGEFEIAGKPVVKLVGEKKVRLRLNLVAKIATPDAILDAMRIIGRDVYASLRPLQGDLFEN